MFGLTGLNHTAHLLTVYASPPQSPTSTQDSFLAGGQPLPGGLNCSRQAPQEGFFDFVPLLHRVLPPQALPGALTVTAYVTDGRARARGRSPCRSAGRIETSAEHI
jgi:hypothetical protein